MGLRSEDVPLGGPGTRSPGKTPRRSEGSSQRLTSYQRPQAPTRVLMAICACCCASGRVALAWAALISRSASANSWRSPSTAVGVAADVKVKAGLGDGAEAVLAT